jgi:hypothetical protein
MSCAIGNHFSAGTPQTSGLLAAGLVPSLQWAVYIQGGNGFIPRQGLPSSLWGEESSDGRVHLFRLLLWQRV